MDSEKEKNEKDPNWDFNAPSYLDFDNLDKEMEDPESYFEKNNEEAEEPNLFQKDLETKQKSKKTETWKKLQQNRHHKMRLNASTQNNISIASCSSRSGLVSAEERELEEIEIARKNAERIKEESKKSYEMLYRVPEKKIRTVEVTQVQEFNFSSDKRLKKHSMQTRKDSEMSFDKNLRKKTLTNYVPKPTVPQPFSFGESNNRKRKVDQAMPSSFVSTAKAIQDFQKKTPARFRVSSKRTVNTKPQPMKALKMTHPQTPKFRCNTRSRTAHVESQQDKEDQEVEEMKMNQFHAKPANKKLLLKADELKAVPKKPSTVPIGFNFLKVTRSSSFKSQPTEVVPKVFKANPVPAAVRNTVQPSEKKSEVPLTRPKSPNFALKGRPVRVPRVPSTPPKMLFKETYKTRSGVSTSKIVKQANRGPTSFKPFNFDQSDRDRFAEKENKIRQEIEEQRKLASAFKAQPLPDTDKVTGVPEKAQIAPTKPQPFQQNIEKRVGARIEVTKEKLKVQEAEDKEKRVFKANTNIEKIVQGDGWRPKLNHSSFTVPKDIELHSETRAEKRKEYDQEMEQARLFQEAISQEEKNEKEEKDKEEVKRLRKELVTRANPITKYKPVEIAKSSKSLTVPKTPKFSTRFNK